jgi:hypothetical protein
MQSIIGVVLNDGGFGQLGFYSLGLMYGVFGILSFFSAPIIRKLGDKWSIVISCFICVIGTVAQLLAVLRGNYPDSKIWINLYWPIYVLILLTSALNGAG